MDISNRPNIVMIIVDALRPKDLSLYGYHKEVDKNIKRIAKESVVFENNFTASNLSDPSKTSIFSGQYPFTNGIIHQYPFIKQSEIDKLKKLKFWLPIYLKHKGYSTIATTSLHLWMKKGFDYIKEDDVDKNPSKFKNFFKKVSGNERLLKVILKFPDILYRFAKKLSGGYHTPYKDARQIVDLSIDKIKDEKDPFFLFMHFEDTHYPYPGAKTPPKMGNTTVKKVVDNISVRSQKEYVKKRFFDASATTLEQMKEKLNNAIVNVDNEIGRLYDYLDESNKLENTIFMIFSDHGTTFGEHNIYFEHSGLYDESIHVPLIMKIPGISPRRVNALTQSIDIVPTILEVLGDKKEIDGKSLLKIMKNGGEFRDKIFCVDTCSEKAFTIRDKKRKLIVSDSKGCYLCGAAHHLNFEEYDLEKDPEEKVNIYNGNSGFEKDVEKIEF